MTYTMDQRLKDGKKATALRGRNALLQLIADQGPIEKRHAVELLMNAGYINTMPSDLITAAVARTTSWFGKLSGDGTIVPSDDGWVVKSTASQDIIATAMNRKGRRASSTLVNLQNEIEQVRKMHPDIADALDDDIADLLAQIRIVIDQWTATS